MNFVAETWINLKRLGLTRTRISFLPEPSSAVLKAKQQSVRIQDFTSWGAGYRWFPLGEVGVQQLLLFTALNTRISRGVVALLYGGNLSSYFPGCTLVTHSSHPVYMRCEIVHKSTVLQLGPRISRKPWRFLCFSCKTTRHFQVENKLFYKALKIATSRKKGRDASKTCFSFRRSRHFWWPQDLETKKEKTKFMKKVSQNSHTRVIRSSFFSKTCTFSTKFQKQELFEKKTAQSNQRKTDLN